MFRESLSWSSFEDQFPAYCWCALMQPPFYCTDDPSQDFFMVSDPTASLLTLLSDSTFNFRTIRVHSCRDDISVLSNCFIVSVLLDDIFIGRKNLMRAQKWYCVSSDISDEWAQRWAGDFELNPDLHLPAENKFIGQYKHKLWSLDKIHRDRQL